MDNLCMLKTVVNGWKDLTLDSVSYIMQCGDKKLVSNANNLGLSLGVVLTAVVLLFTSFH